jgi:lysozyme
MTARAEWRVFIAILAALALGFGVIRLLYPRIELAAMRYEVKGIDVSHHQGVIDWARLKADGVDFAYIKASEGETYNDPRFTRNWYEAEQAGVKRGAYHFFTQCRTGKAQAGNFIRVVPRQAGTLPPAVDAEHMGPCRDGPAVADVAAELAVFLDLAGAHFGQRPVIYTTREFHDAYLAGKFPQDRFWLRSLIFEPSFRKEQWIIWQYHNLGKRDGVAGPIDLNVFRGTPAQLDALLAPN